MSSSSNTTDKEIEQLAKSITKALDTTEIPIKSKHTRSIIVATYRPSGGSIFWNIVLKQSLQANRTVAWKFCSLLHIILREGNNMSQQSIQHREKIIQLGSLWGHLSDEYGICIKQYTKLLVNKISFHNRNSNIPGNLIMEKAQLKSVAGSDVNVCFELVLEIFDYLNDVLSLQNTVFNTIAAFRLNTNNSTGHCFLAPLITCIEDSTYLYDMVFHLMFWLHEKLPQDLLAGHRDNFNGAFFNLKKFYSTVMSHQFFTNLLTIKQLPDQPPNFLDFVCIVANALALEQLEEETLVAIIQSEVNPTAPPATPFPVRARQQDISTPLIPIMQPLLMELEDKSVEQSTFDLQRKVLDQDEWIKHLQSEIERQSKQLKTSHLEISCYQEQISVLHQELLQSRNEIFAMKIEKQKLEMELKNNYFV